METIDIWRGKPAKDADGNTIQEPLVKIGSLQALVAPITTPETPTETSPGVAHAYTLYVRSQQPTGVTATDLIGVRGERLPVDGDPAVWVDRQGRHVGDVITVKRRE
ncbi:hypothetical protein BACT_0493 [Bifidobacterium actinocoloniiforme DSM 22766]|uniref:Uncharacterized protein n=1 Tax=Bifidobacterium actinocoloniiforme DSM 22766 TaxID=1437605 RepID=A0A086YZU3_9BIFI|nr:hypothetical protein [Bifidobacterium actinocoloniiforme]AKV55081.1 hypothetical protein AB656_01085 [Bifidobacterium actinocoloniiforme DSM 22766]KFI39793.1 hypothetical protein BACT_0493 [Bifidobacterium actinocoloniiforme DSM 22766]